MTSMTQAAPNAGGAGDPVLVVDGELVREGGGVRNIVTIGSRALPDLDPFLLLAEFGGPDPADYAGGFPPHPHRGFETLTYVLEGRLRHADSRGNAGRLGPGAVQRMTAARGILHAELPDQTEGPLRALQIWINLPARHKTDEPRYRDVEAAETPAFKRPGVRGRVLVGSAFGHQSTIQGGPTDLLFLDLTLAAGASLAVPIGAAHAAIAYVLDGRARFGDRAVLRATLAVLSPQPHIAVTADEPSRLVLLTARPIGEPVARHGPFVMNTEAEILRAAADYRAGRFGQLDLRSTARTGDASASTRRSGRAISS